MGRARQGKVLGWVRGAISTRSVPTAQPRMAAPRREPTVAEGTGRRGEGFEGVLPAAPYVTASQIPVPQGQPTGGSCFILAHPTGGSRTCPCAEHDGRPRSQCLRAAHLRGLASPCHPPVWASHSPAAGALSLQPWRGSVVDFSGKGQGRPCSAWIGSGREAAPTPRERRRHVVVLVNGIS